MCSSILARLFTCFSGGVGTLPGVAECELVMLLSLAIMESLMWLIS